MQTESVSSQGQRVITTAIVLYKHDVLVGVIIETSNHQVIQSAIETVCQRVSIDRTLVINRTLL